MKLGNESPIGLATILTAAPGVAAFVIFLVVWIRTGDLDQAEQGAAALIALLSLGATGISRNVRAGKGEISPVTGDELHGGTPLPTGAEDETP